MNNNRTNQTDIRCRYAGVRWLRFLCLVIGLFFGDALHAEACFPVESGEIKGAEEQGVIGEDRREDKTYQVGDVHEEQGDI